MVIEARVCPLADPQRSPGTMPPEDLNAVKVGALGCTPRNEVEDVPVLVLPKLGFARMVLFGEF
jgi:hypothetical protein